MEKGVNAVSDARICRNCEHSGQAVMRRDGALNCRWLKMLVLDESHCSHFERQTTFNTTRNDEPGLHEDSDRAPRPTELPPPGPNKPFTNPAG